MDERTVMVALLAVDGEVVWEGELQQMTVSERPVLEMGGRYFMYARIDWDAQITAVYEEINAPLQLWWK